MTHCTEIPTHGNPLERCHIHHEQYRTMTKRYKEAQKFVDETFAGALIPSKEDVQNYTSIPTILEQARLVKKYVNAIREERAGRDIHHKRFFLKSG
jgi:transcriptional accessory protein Tex/SPT6